MAAFLHPSFIYPLTWIAQRNDLLLIIFAVLALANIDRRRGLAYLALSDMAKTPFGFHNLLFNGPPGSGGCLIDRRLYPSPAP